MMQVETFSKLNNCKEMSEGGFGRYPKEIIDDEHERSL